MRIKKNTLAFSVVSWTCQYTIYYNAVRMCVYCVDMTDTSGHIMKQDQRTYVKIKTLRGLQFWTPTRGKCCLPYSPDMSPCHEIKRTIRKPPFSDFTWPKFGHDPTYPRAELQWPTWYHQQASRSLKICHRSQGGLHWTT